ncbi:MAG: adenylosuccinate synthetase [Candidatus Falkowbacteria bacterium]|nr:adenylosuccinate synthetase [Candidatus Falkowbacteria bacterium]
MKKLYTVTDLGGGDGGKGAVVHKLSSLNKAHTIIKVGGAQGSHGVRTSYGENFNFSQFGCGTFEGAKTYLSELMVIDPYLLLDEGRRLKYHWGIGNIFDYIAIDAQALCITPFHLIASQLTEMSRKKKQKGTVGIGAGEAVLGAEKHPESSIRARDFGSPGLRDKLAAIRLQKTEDLQEIISLVPEFWKKDQEQAKILLELLADDNFVDDVVEAFNLVGSSVKVFDRDYLSQQILGRDGVVVVESSHGILTDRYHGFCPYVSRLRTVPEFSWKLLEDCAYDGEIVKIALTRAYQIRHGAGPMVTENSDWSENLLPGSSKQDNRWQGKVRIGPLDFVSLRYALEVCGGPQMFSGLALTWFDQIQSMGKWDWCEKYQGELNDEFFTSSGCIKFNPEIGQGKTKHQEGLSAELFRVRPDVTSYKIGTKNQKELFDFSKELINNQLNMPISMISFGPTEKDKICF